MSLLDFFKKTVNEVVDNALRDDKYDVHLIFNGKSGGTYNGMRYLAESISSKNKTALVNEGIQFEPSENEKGGIIVFSTDVNAEELSKNKIINFLKQKTQSIINRLSATKKIDKIAVKNKLVGWTIGHYFSGRYTSPTNGKQYGENSLSLEIIGIDFEKLCQIAMELCESFHQESVLVKDFSSGRVLFINPS